MMISFSSIASSSPERGPVDAFFSFFFDFPLKHKEIQQQTTSNFPLCSAAVAIYLGWTLLAEVALALALALTK
jgi:hypothetical protein